MLLLAALCAAKEEAKKDDKKAAEPQEGKELIMLELERVVDSRDKRQTEGEVDFSGKEVRSEPQGPGARARARGLHFNQSVLFQNARENYAGTSQ